MQRKASSLLKKIVSLFLILLLTTSCSFIDYQLDSRSSNQYPSENINKGKNDTNKNYINSEGITIEERILPPGGFVRAEVSEDSYEEFLRKLPLKPDGSKVLYYDGSTKNKDNVYEAVVDMEIGSRDLQQCADAIIRLRAEYLFKQEKYDEIHFNFTNGFRVDYKKWMEGYRIAVDGNEVQWVKRAEFSDTYEDFRKYLDIVFAYAGTLSLSQELKTVEVEEMQIGNIFIQGGSPGHAVLVIDMVENSQTGEKLFLLAQSYMPAQEIQILKNPMNTEISPWYSLDFEEKLFTPEWTFTKQDLKRF